MQNPLSKFRIYSLNLYNYCWFIVETQNAKILEEKS